MKKRFNPELLQEEKKRFMSLMEYDFYQEKKEPVSDFKKDIILGDLEEAEEQTEKPEGAENIEADLELNTSDDQETTSDIPEPEQAPEDGGSEELDFQEEPAQEMPPQEPAGDEVEVDVTSLVKGSEEAKNSADNASKNSQLLLQKLTDLENRVASMGAITNKIDDLEREIIKRNPTPVEKLEMQSLNSYPFNQKLSDYWGDKEGQYDVMDKKKKEYILTKDDVDSGYSESQIKRTFTQEQNPFDVEDIDDYTEENI